MNESSDGRFRPREDLVPERRIQADRLYLLDIVRVLRPHAAGLRRWSVMHKIRAYREAAGLPIDHRMEVTVERLYRNHCADAEKFKKCDTVPDTALFFWPQGKLGGVWAVYSNRADAWLKREGFEL